MEKTNNELIAEFLGWKYNENLKCWENDRSAFTKHSLLFNLSWDWLVPVLEKIKSMEHDEIFMSTNPEREIQFASVIGLPIFTPLSIVYLRTVEFIKWYNQVK
jgi:hypothetical protein